MTETPRLPVPVDARPPREVTSDRASILEWRRFHAPPRGWAVESSNVKQLGEDYDRSCDWCGRAIGDTASRITHEGYDRKLFTCEECTLALVVPTADSTYTEADRSDALEHARYTKSDRCRRVNKRMAMRERSNWKSIGGPAFRYYPPEWDENETLVIFWRQDSGSWFWKAVLPDGTIDESGPHGDMDAARERFVSRLMAEENASGWA